jgi:Fis family transcriptional regulator, factor for inversion stimulation protein
MRTQVSPRAGARSAKGANERSGTGSNGAVNALPGSARNGETLGQCVTRHLEQYFAALDGARPHALHEMVLSAVERPLLQFAMQRAHGNQSAAAELLGINRNTLRKKLVDYKLIAD